MEDNIREFPEVAQLSKEEIGAIIGFLIGYEGRVKLAKEDFRMVFGREISIKVLNTIKRKYSDEIREGTEKLAKDGMLNPLSRPDYQQKLLWMMFQRAARVEVRGFLRADKDEFVEDLTDDPSIMKGCIELAHKINIDWEKIRIEKHKCNLDVDAVRGGERETDVDDGIDDNWD